MIVRKMMADEIYKLDAISSVAFEYGIDYDKLKNPDEKEKTPETLVEGFGKDTIGAMSDDEKTLYGGMAAIPFKMRYDSHEVLMRGIGGVCTLPPYRRNGTIRECFKFLFPRMKEQNMIFSFLYPFNCAYYRSFGYEINAPLIDWTIDFKGLKPFDVEGTTEFLMPEDNLDVIHDLYTQMNRNYNLSVIRQDNDFEYMQKRDTFNKQRYAYIWRNKDGVAKAYILFKKENVDNKNIMDCTHNFWGKNDFVFVDSEGFCGLINFALTFASNYDAIKFTVGANTKIDGLIDNTNFANARYYYSGMVRVMDVEKVLLLSYFKGSGKIRLKIADKYCDWNNGVFEVEFSDDKAVSVKKSDGEFDAQMDISTFSTLICGTYSSIRECMKSDLIIENEDADFDKIFYFKPNRVTDLF